MTFWLIAVAIPLITALIIFRPLLGNQSGFIGLGIALLLLIPVTSLLLYQGVGTPEGIAVTATPPTTNEEVTGADINELLAQLEARMEEQPNDLQGWMLLARSYKSLQRYDDALMAMQQARSIAPNDPVIAVELAEAMIFTSGPDGPGEDVRLLLDDALTQDGFLQKGLWLAGMVAVQSGRDADAIGYWESLMQQLEPGSNVAASVQEQLEAAYARQGIEAPETPALVNAATEIPAKGGWSGVDVTVTRAEQSALPAQAALFVIARDPSAPTPPLGAMRISQPEFPLTVTLSDANSMMPQRPISGVARIELIARLSMSGNPLPAEGDPESMGVSVSTDGRSTAELNLPATAR